MSRLQLYANGRRQYEYLAKEIKKHSAKVQFAELVNGKLGDKFEAIGQKDIFSLFDWLQSEVESIKINTNTSSKIGTDIKRTPHRSLTNIASARPANPSRYGSRSFRPLTNKSAAM
jgi:replicative DNA helicase